MKKVVIVFIIFMVALTGYITLKHDLQIKNEAKSAMVDLSSNHEDINKKDIQRALSAFEDAKNNVRFLNTDREEKARSVVEHAKFCIELAEEGVKMAEGLAKNNDSDFIKELNKKHIAERTQDVNREKKELSEKMKIILASY